eukprot:13518190-Alexandrium_andersonii.AAC.1
MSVLGSKRHILMLLLAGDRYVLDMRIRVSGVLLRIGPYCYHRSGTVDPLGALSGGIPWLL